jgi:protein TonB
MAPRFTSGAGMSLLITFGLLFVMQALVAVDELDIIEEGPPTFIDFVRVVKDSETPEEPRKLEKPKPRETPPPPVDLALPTRASGQGIAMIQPVAPEPDLGGAGFLTRRNDTDVVPVVRVNPTYPQRLAARGIEGWVELEFSIGKAGEVVSPRVSASSDSGFERAALRAVRRWRYNPKLEDGKPVIRDGIRVRLTFALDQATV